MMNTSPTRGGVPVGSEKTTLVCGVVKLTGPGVKAIDFEECWMGETSWNAEFDDS